MINSIKKRCNLILGLLLALFLILIVMKTVSVTKMHDVNVNDFSIMRTVGVPYNSDVKECLSIFKDGIGDAYNFDSLYSSAYVLFIFGIISMVLCFKKFNKSFASKAIILVYSLFAIYTLIFSANLGYVYRVYDKTYILKLIVAVLIFAFSLGSVVSMLKKLASDGWFKNVNIHAFLNGISAGLILITTVLMFLPFAYKGEKTASIMGYALLPGNYKSTFGAYLSSNIDNFRINVSILVPVVLFVLGVIAVILLIGSHKNSVPTIMAFAWAVIGVLGFIFSAFLKTDPKMILYIVLFAAVIVMSVINLFQFKKVRDILG